MKLFSQNSNLYDHDTSTLQTDRRTTCLGNTALRVASRGKRTGIFVAHVSWVPALLRQLPVFSNRVSGVEVRR